MSCINFARLTVTESAPRPWVIRAGDGTVLARCPTFALAERLARNLTDDGKAMPFTIKHKRDEK